MMKLLHLPRIMKSKYHCCVARSLFLALLTALLIGCNASPSFVGVWTCESAVMTLDTKTVTEHKADGTFKSVTTTQKSPDGAYLTATDTGTWKLDGNKLTQLYTDIDWKFSGGKPEVMKRASQRFKEVKPTVIAESNRAGTGTISWKGNDEFEYVDKAGKKYIYRRQK